MGFDASSAPWLSKGGNAEGLGPNDLWQVGMARDFVSCGKSTMEKQSDYLAYGQDPDSRRSWIC